MFAKMKSAIAQLSTPFAILSLSLLLSGCAGSSSLLDSAMGVLESTQNKPLTAEEVSLGLKEALTIGITEGATTLAAKNGYLGSEQLRIPFPEDVQVVEEKLRSIGLNREMDRIVESLNRAAEDAAKEAIPIFTDAIRQLTIQDAFAILKGENNAATAFLRRTTETQLTQKFRSPIKNSLDKVDATKYWSDAMGTYNRIPFVKDVNTDLTGYVTAKAIDGLFVMVAQEEAEIRENPLARTTALLKRVFGQN